MTDNKSLVHKIFEAINRRDLDAMLEYLADDMTCILPDGTRIDKKGVRKDFTGNLFPGMRMHVDLVVSQGSKVVVQWTATEHTRENAQEYTGQTKQPRYQAYGFLISMLGRSSSLRECDF